MDLAPDATTPSKLTPEYPPIGVLPLHDLRASVSGYCSRLTREVLAQSAIVSIPALWPIGRSQQPRRLSHQCLQIVGFQFFLKLPADVHHRLVTDAQLLSDVTVGLAFR